MGKYRKILVAYDGSESSRNALRQAIKLAMDKQCWIKVLTVMPAYEGEVELTGVKDIGQILSGSAGKLLDQAEDIAKAEGASIISGYELGEPFERIAEVAETENCDLIVMGRRGVSRLERALLGSVSARVIGHTGKDVLVVPRDAVLGWQRVLLATDGSKYSEAAAERAIDFAGSYDHGRLLALSVVDVEAEIYAESPQLVEKMTERAKAVLDAVKAKAESAGVKVETFIKEGPAYEKITDLARQVMADIIFMGSHGRKGIRKLLMGSVTEKVIGHARCPVMVVKQKA